MKTTEINVKSIGHLYSESDMLTIVGHIAGECYNSSMDIVKSKNRALNCIRRGHHSPWEHVCITLKCIVDRGVSHALVRHRHCAFQQSSTIYQKFDELIFIKDSQLSQDLGEQIEREYKEMINMRIKPSEARDVLPNCLATSLIITANIRQWMYMMQRRCGPGDSDNMHEWCRQVRVWFEEHYPTVTGTFDDWYVQHPL